MTAFSMMAVLLFDVMMTRIQSHRLCHTSNPSGRLFFYLAVSVLANRAFVGVIVALQWSCAEGLGMYNRRIVRNNGSGYGILNNLLALRTCLVIVLPYGVV
jgi:hypothetical protein